VFVGASYFDTVERLTFEHNLHRICMIMTAMSLSTCLRAGVALAKPKQGLGFRV
jgi:hypothetical protein